MFLGKNESQIKICGIALSYGWKNRILKSL